jgi:transposase
MGDGPDGYYHYVGLDVHKATISVALAAGGRDGAVRQVEVFENHLEILRKLVARLGTGGRRLSFCCEAGPAVTGCSGC